jgi:hypothetical protein
VPAGAGGTDRPGDDAGRSEPTTMTTNGTETGRPARRYAMWAVQGVAGLLGAAWGFDFGVQVAGIFLGVVAALNLAVFAALLAGAALERLMALGRRGADRG